MGSGKTTLGRALAEYLPGCGFIDLDAEIERRAVRSISEIFADGGEDVFRRLEAKTLRTLTFPSETKVCVVATGGGTPCRQGAMEWMNSQGTTVLLQPSRGVLLRRLREGAGGRPLIKDLSPRQLEEFVDSELERRAPYYSQASASFSSDLLEDASQIAFSCQNFINQFLSK